MAATKPTGPVVSDLSEGALEPDGTRRHRFTIDGVDIQIRAVVAEHEQAAADLATRLRDLAPLLAAPAPRETPWGPGQFDDLQIGPGVRVALRITDKGRLLFYAPPGPLDVTEASASLGTGLHQAGARAAQIRARLAARAGRAPRRGRR